MEPKKKPAARKSTARHAAKPKTASTNPKTGLRPKAAASARPAAANSMDLAAPVAADLPAVTSPSTVMPQLDSNSNSGANPDGSATAPASSRGHGRHGWWVIGGTVVGLIAVFLLVFGALVYKYDSDSRIVQIVADIVPYPAEQVNGHFVSYSDYLFEVNSIKHYYLSQTNANGQPAAEFTSADGRQKLAQLQTQVLQELQQESIVRAIAAKDKLTVTSAEVQAQVDSITKQAGGDQKVKDVLKKYYGWSINDLKKKISYQLLQQKVTNKVQSDPGLNAQAKAKAQGILKQLQGGADFATLAKKDSQDSSAANGGDLGFFGKGQMVPAFQNAAFALQPGQLSGVVQTQYGFSIIKVIEYNADKSQVHAAQILIKPIDFTQYLQNQVNSAKIHQYIHPSANTN